MTIGAGIFLAAVGAILTFAVNATVAGLNIHAIGVILMVAGVLGIALELAVFAPRRRVVRTTGYATGYATQPLQTVRTVQAPVATTVVPAEPLITGQPVAPAPVVTETRY